MMHTRFCPSKYWELWHNSVWRWCQVSKGLPTMEIKMLLRLSYLHDKVFWIELGPSNPHINVTDVYVQQWTPQYKTMRWSMDPWVIPARLPAVARWKCPVVSEAVVQCFSTHTPRNYSYGAQNGQTQASATSQNTSVHQFFWGLFY